MLIDIKEMFTMSKTKLIKQNEFLCAVIEHNKEVFVEVLKENEDLKLELMNYENGYLATENRTLKDEYKELKEKYFNNLTDNEYLEKRVEELEIDLKEYHKIQDKQQEKLEDSMLYGEDNPYYLEKYHPKLYQEILKNKSLENRVEQLESELEIKERLDTDKPLEEDYYSTKELDYGLLSKTIDKITDERNTYKEVINVMCDKFDISHDSVLNIIDDISLNKGVEIERV